MRLANFLNALNRAAYLPRNNATIHRFSFDNQATGETRTARHIWHSPRRGHRGAGYRAANSDTLEIEHRMGRASLRAWGQNTSRSHPPSEPLQLEVGSASTPLMSADHLTVVSMDVGAFPSFVPCSGMFSMRFVIALRLRLVGAEPPSSAGATSFACYSPEYELLKYSVLS